MDACCLQCGTWIMSTHPAVQSHLKNNLHLFHKVTQPLLAIATYSMIIIIITLNIAGVL